MSPWFWAWLAVLVVTLIVEASTSALVSIWFSAGAFVALLMSISSSIPWYAQVIVFVILSLTLLLSLRRISLKALKERKSKKGFYETNLDRYLNKEFEITEVLEGGKRAFIKINDVEWDVVVNGHNFVVGDKVKIIDFSGAKAIVEKLS